jgi:RNA polymerase sigma-70 factor (ECF subfamily)
VCQSGLERVSTANLQNSLMKSIFEAKPKILALAKRYAPNETDPEDFFQDAALLALKNLKSYRGDAKLSTWFCSIVKNCSRMEARKRIHRHEHADIALMQMEELPKTISPEEQSDAFSIFELIGVMPDAETRALFQLIYIEGYTLIAASQLVGMVHGTAKARICRGKRYLRKRLGLKTK